MPDSMFGLRNLHPVKSFASGFNHDDNKFMQFKQRHLAELEANSTMAEFVSLVKKQLPKQDVLFLYGAKNKEHNQAVVLKEKIISQL